MDKCTLKAEIEKEFGAGVSRMKALGAGSFGKVYPLEFADGRRAVIKVYKAAGVGAMEAKALKLLREHCCVHIPEVYFFKGAEGDMPDLLCMERIEGRDAFTNFALLLKSKKLKRHFAEQVVDAMLSIHSFTSPTFGYVDDPRSGSWQEFYRPFAFDIAKKAEALYEAGKLPKYVHSALRRGFALYDRIFDEEVTEACLVHGDLNVMNVLVKPPFEVTGIIDPLRSMFGDREYDLFQLNNLTGKAFGLYDLYKQRYPVSKNCDVKCAFYALINEAFCFVTTGRMTSFIMRAAVKEANAQFAKLEAA